ncbi:COX15/CtaA family protein, partial [Rhodovulum sulfidophilum]|uniref:COX15/CtaA family protein n=1 Tax=Rhodovulum sulfidophilum TaxID=35806 RepID=UPI0019207C4E
ISFAAASLRLAAMTGFGFAGMGLAAWGAMQLRRTEAQLMQARRARDGRAFGMATGVMHLAFLQILFGAMLGALDQGRSFPDWPLMAGGILPPEPLALEPVWRNIWDNPGLVQFIHRGLGYLVVLLGLAAWLRGRKSPHARTRRAFDWLGVMIFGQAVLGVGAVLYAGQWHMALTHLVGAVLLWVLVLRARFMAQYPVQQSIRG